MIHKESVNKNEVVLLKSIVAAAEDKNTARRMVMAVDYDEHDFILRVKLPVSVLKEKMEGINNDDGKEIKRFIRSVSR